MRKRIIVGAISLLAFGANAQEIKIGNESTTSVDLSIYNNNLALVKDVRNVSLKQGENIIAFEGVAREIRPETVRIKVPGAVILEQNYEYNVLSYANMLQETVGQEVKTAMVNPANGQMIFDKAKLINAEYGQPILEFEYGVEANYPGRVVYDKLPANLRQKPTMVANVKADAAMAKSMEMLYLTQGMSWKADYVADIKNAKELDLSAWITLNNNSGVDYKDAVVNVISGNINQEGGYYPMQEMAMDMAAPRAMKAMAGMAAAPMAPMPVSEGIGDYYLYALPLKTTIKDKQTKQVSLFAKESVKYEKVYKINSPIYTSFGARASEVKNIKPQVIVKLNNVETNNLGLPIPQGVVRFYDKDSKGNAQFLGESRIEQLAVGGEAELNLGSSFDIFAKAKLQNVRVLSDDIMEAEAEVEINNSTAAAVKVEYWQNFGNSWDILNESIKSVQENANMAKWVVEVPATGKTVLSFKVRVSRK